MHVFRSNHTPQNRKLKTISSALNESGCVKSPPLISNDVDKLQFAKVMADSRNALARRFFSISHFFLSLSLLKKSGFFFRDGRSIVLWTVEKKAKSIFIAVLEYPVPPDSNIIDRLPSGEHTIFQTHITLFNWI